MPSTPRVDTKESFRSNRMLELKPVEDPAKEPSKMQILEKLYDKIKGNPGQIQV